MSEEQVVEQEVSGEMVVAELPEEYDLVEVSVSNDTINELQEIAQNRVTIAKVVDGGFEIDKNFFSNLKGRIVNIHLHLIKFNDENEPTILPNTTDDNQIPEGFSRRANVDLQVGSQVVRLRCPPYTTNWMLSRYVTALKDEGLNPSEVITKAYVVERKAKSMKWNAIAFDKFQIVDRAKHMAAVKAAAANDELPF